MLAEDCALTLSNHILSGRNLRSLVDTGLIFRIETVSSVIYSTIILYNELGIEGTSRQPHHLTYSFR